MIAKLVEPEKGIYWDLVIDKVEHVLNNTQHRSIKQSPSKMLFAKPSIIGRNEKRNSL